MTLPLAMFASSYNSDSNDPIIPYSKNSYSNNGGKNEKTSNILKEMTTGEVIETEKF